jgi:channel protein (hemolysin III family)
MAGVIWNLAALGGGPGGLIAGYEPPLRHLPGLHEPFSAVTHLLGAGMFLVLSIALVRRAGSDRRRRAVMSIYGFTCVLLLLMSGGFHMTISGSEFSGIMKRLDHAAIYVLIAGTFTPIHGLLFRGWLRWFPLVLLWVITAFGVIIKIAFFSTMSSAVSLTLYFAMGWFGLLGGLVLCKQRGFCFVRPLLLGGLCYTAGAVMDLYSWPTPIPGVVQAHDMFHLCVLGGMAFHFAFIWRTNWATITSDELNPNDRADPCACPRRSTPTKRRGSLRRFRRDRCTV